MGTSGTASATVCSVRYDGDGVERLVGTAQRPQGKYRGSVGALREPVEADVFGVMTVSIPTIDATLRPAAALANGRDAELVTGSR